MTTSQATRSDHNPLAKIFETFAGTECHGSSPLYEYLARIIARDEDLLAIAARGRTPIPNLFFAAVHHLVLSESSSPLAQYYPSAGGTRIIDVDLTRTFREFCLARRQAIEALLATRLVQTNEVRRCGYLAPAFCHIARTGRNQPLALIEIGCSAGLNLLWDHYAYDFGQGRHWGNPQSDLQIKSESRGPLPEMPNTPPEVELRIGLDLNPILPSDAEGIRWLQALIWPEHSERRNLLQKALTVGARSNLQLIACDASLCLHEALERIPAHDTACVFQTHTLNQFSKEAHDRVMQALADFGRTRPLYFLSRSNDLSLETWTPSGHEKRLLAKTDGHGSWFAWE